MRQMQRDGSKSRQISGHLYGLWKGQKLSLQIRCIFIGTVEEAKLLGITIDSKLQFQSHVAAMCNMANQKVKAFSRITEYLQKHKAYLLYKTL